MLILFLFQNSVHVNSHHNIFMFLQTLFDAILSVSKDLTLEKQCRRIKYSKMNTVWNMGVIFRFNVSYLVALRISSLTW